MAGKNIAERVKELIEETVSGLGYQLWDVEYVKEGADWYLRVTVDAEAGIGTEDCEKVSRAIDPILDEADPIEGSYYLEVSSPGLERELRTEEHIRAFIGSKVSVKLFTALEGKKQYDGVLTAYADGALTLTVPERTEPLVIGRELVSKIKTVFDFD